jgi:glycosyltransferase involved in cell wall biosynthesis
MGERTPETDRDALRVLAITRKPDSPSFEQRVLRYVEPLRRRGIDVEVRTLPKRRDERQALRRLTGGFGVVWWHKHLTAPTRAGAWRRAARRIVYDFDDPVFLSTHPGRIRGQLGRRIKFALWLRRCDAALAGNEVLAERARRHCPRVHVVPMGIDLGPPPPERPATETPELLWMGSRATTRFLRGVLDALEKLAAGGRAVRLRVVGHEVVTGQSVQVDYRPWSPQAQADALRECHVGLCPMPDTPWTRGKCPFKVLEYMAAGLPWVGSPVGENVTLAGSAGRARGLCAGTDEQWVEALSRLLHDADLRRRMGVRGREYVERHHGREALADRLANLLRRIAAQG